MNFHFTYLLVFIVTFLNAQVVDLEEFDIPTEFYLDGSENEGGFTSGDIFLPNDYNEEFMSWTGWAISNTTDVTTPGFSNQYSAYTGSGYNGSENYAVSYSFGANIIRVEGDSKGQPISGLYITNTTYPYLSMQDGDAFAKKFGGLTGEDPDFFLLTIKAYYNGSQSSDSVNFYLADFRFEDNTKDYIVDTWSFVDLTSLGPVDSLSFLLNSSDVGQFGMNTPAYFCVDNVLATGPTSVSKEFIFDLVDISPNPTTNYIRLNHSEDEDLSCRILDVNGRTVFEKNISPHANFIDLGFLPKGSYILSVQGKSVISTKTLMKL